MNKTVSLMLFIMHNRWMDISQNQDQHNERQINLYSSNVGIFLVNTKKDV